LPERITAFRGDRFVKAAKIGAVGESRVVGRSISRRETARDSMLRY